MVYEVGRINMFTKLMQDERYWLI